MVTFEKLKDGCTLQGKIRRGEEEGMVIPWDDTIREMVFFGFMEYEEGMDCLLLLNYTIQEAKDTLNPRNRYKGRK